MTTARRTVVMRSPRPLSARRQRPSMRAVMAGSDSMISTMRSRSASSAPAISRSRVAMAERVGRVSTCRRISSMREARSWSWVWGIAGLSSAGCGAQAVVEAEEFVDLVEEGGELEGLLEERVGAGGEELVDLVLVDDAADKDDACLRKGGVGADALADDVAVDVGEHV